MKKSIAKFLKMSALAILTFGLTSCNMWSLLGRSNPFGDDDSGYVNAKGAFENKSYDDKIGVNSFSPDPTVHATGGVTSFPDSGEGYSRLDTSRTLSYSEINGTTGASNIPSTSSEPFHVLVIPVEIVGWEFSKTYPNYRQDLINTLNGDGYSDTGYWESVSSFYRKSSYGKLNLQFDIAPIYNCGLSAKGLAKIDNGGAEGPISILNNAVSLYRQRIGREAMRQYDNDGDGWLDGVIMIYSCPDFASSLSISAIDPNGELYWAFCYWAAEYYPTASEKSDPVANLFFWASASFLYTQSTRSPRSDAHTFIHEFGHMLGLDDYYAVMTGEGYSSYNPAGGWIMEDHNILDHDIWSKMALGWVNPYVVTGDCTIEINPSAYNGDCILVPSRNYNGTAFSEFLIMELYTPTDLNYLDSHEKYEKRELGYSTYGVRLWHVDSRIARGTLRGNEISWAYYDGSTIPNDGHPYKVAASNSSKNVSISANYSLLSLIDASGTIDFASGGLGENKCLFQSGDTFKQSNRKYAKYFPNGELFNDGSSVGVTISFDLVKADKAVISFSF
ncbi:MAG: hypothetical protein J6328_06760 [Bacilli bacterium]|nr:hypothetical protein [Bacilli bacterium]